VGLGGTIYAPNAIAVMQGSGGGSGGTSDANLAIQFITYDLQLGGNPVFHFVDRVGDATPVPDYGLVQVY
jgi:hypothetical protein